MKNNDRSVNHINLTTDKQRRSKIPYAFGPIPKFFNTLGAMSFLPKTRKIREIKDIFKGGF